MAVCTIHLPIDRVGQGLATKDCLGTIGPGLALQDGSVVDTGVETLHLHLSLCRVHLCRLRQLKVPCTRAPVLELRPKVDPPLVWVLPVVCDIIAVVVAIQVGRYTSWVE